eukprot:3616025-Rhodomonas_salina.2
MQTIFMRGGAMTVWRSCEAGGRRCSYAMSVPGTARLVAARALCQYQVCYVSTGNRVRRS